MTKYKVYKSTPEDRDIYRPPIMCETHIREIAEAVVDHVFRQMTEGCVYIEKVEGDTRNIVSWRDTRSEVRNETYTIKACSYGAYCLWLRDLVNRISGKGHHITEIKITMNPEYCKAVVCTKEGGAK